jgi:hypothetical protein
MDLLDLTPQQLMRAASIKEQIAALNKELTNILGISSDGAVARNGRAMSAAAKRKIAAAQKARWAKLRRVKLATRSVKPAAKQKKKTFSATTRAKLSAKLKAYWAKKKSGKK